MTYYGAFKTFQNPVIPFKNSRTNPRAIENIRMNETLRELPVEERIKLVEELWDSIASDQEVLPLADEQKAELDRRLDAYEADGNRGRLATESISEIRRKL